MTFAEFCALPDLDKICLVEVNVGKEIEGETWTVSGGAYWMSFKPSKYGEVVSVFVDGAAMTAEDSVADCQANVNTFFYDYIAERFYVHMTDGDSPATKIAGVYKYCLICRFWKCFTNRQPEESRTIYPGQIGWSQNLAAWSSRKRIPLPIPDADLVDFPVKVPIVAGSPASIAIGAHCLANGYDLRFTAADGVTPLPYERESFAVVAGEATGILWVKSDVAMAGTYIWCYYGNPAAPDGENPTAVWDTNFAGVWHMKDSSPTTIEDSTANANRMIKAGSGHPVETVGKIGKGQDYNGTSDLTTVATSASINAIATGHKLTFEAWIYPEAFPLKCIVGFGGYDPHYGYNFKFSDGGAILLELRFQNAAGDWINTWSDALPPVNQWSHVAVTFDASTDEVAFYINGVRYATVQTSQADNSGSPLITGNPGWLWFEGAIDELRASKIARSAAWIKYAHANMNPADGGLTWGEEESYPSGPPGVMHPVYYLPYLDLESLPPIVQSVGEFYIGDMGLQFGEIGFVNDGWWYGAFSELLWHNAEVWVKVGQKGSSYSDFEPVFVGVVRNPKVSDERAAFAVNDVRVNDLRDVPETLFDVTTYPYMDPQFIGRPIPIPFGFCQGVMPVCIDVDSFIYKFSRYACQSLVVKVAGIVMTITIDYTADLPNGKFTLLFDPGENLVTCDVEGIKCDKDTGLYSENFADGLWFLLATECGIPTANLDEPAFNGLKIARTQKMSYYLSTQMNALEVSRAFQRSAVFQLIPDLDGKWTVRWYQSGSTGAPHIHAEDLEEIGILYRTDGVYKSVCVGYNKDPNTGEYLYAVASDAGVEWRHKEKKRLSVETALYDGNEAVSLAAFYMDLVKAPPKTIEGTIGAVGLNMLPTDKVVLTKVITDAEGDEVQVFMENVYRILEFRKDLGPASTGISGVDDAATIGEYHADVAHVDSHSDSYTDTAHADVEHADSSHSDSEHVDSHGDEVHDDYSDVPHSDTGHEDVPHADFVRDEYDDHQDGPFHTDRYHDAHNDVGHVDVAHTDVPHVDSYSDTHTDTHTDTPHGDGAHSDSEHSDVAHGDVRSDDHSDTPHGDSEF